MKKINKVKIEINGKKFLIKPKMTLKDVITKYKIPEGKQLGLKLKLIEEEWAGNNFKISDQQIDNIIKD